MMMSIESMIFKRELGCFSDDIAAIHGISLTGVSGCVLLNTNCWMATMGNTVSEHKLLHDWCPGNIWISLLLFFLEALPILKKET